MRELLCILTLAALPARGQLFSFGAKAGVPLNNVAEASSRGALSYAVSDRPFTIGPTFEVHLPARTSVAVEALYRRFSYASTQTAPVGFATAVSGGDWSFPVLIRHRLRSGLVRPFLEAGFSFHRLTSLKQVVSCFTVSPGCQAGESGVPAELQRRGTQGLVLGAGIEVRPPIVKISPEIRFTRRRSGQVEGGSGLLKSNLNQLEFLLGVSF